MEYNIYCDTCGGILIATIEADPGDVINTKLSPGLKNHLHHKIHYNEA